MSTAFGMSICDHCGKIITSTDRVYRDDKLIFHQSCWKELVKEADEVRQQAEVCRDFGGYP